MAYIPNRDDPFMPPPAPSADEMRRQARLDSELQDADFRDAPVSSGRVALYAIAILAVLGALFYGLNVANNTSQTASGPTASPPSTMAQTNPAAPRPNSSPGVTTGAAPTTPATPSTPSAPSK